MPGIPNCPGCNIPLSITAADRYMCNQCRAAYTTAELNSGVAAKPVPTHIAQQQPFGAVGIGGPNQLVKPSQPGQPGQVVAQPAQVNYNLKNLVGDLTITVLSAKGLPNRDWGKQDPYISLSMTDKGAIESDKKKRKNTSVIKKGGTEVSWPSEQLTFALGGGEADYMHVAAMDKDFWTKDDICSQTWVPMAEVMKNVGAGPQQYPLYFKGKEAGSVTFSVNWIPFPPGILTVHLKCGKDLDNHDIGKQDPYCLFGLDFEKKPKIKSSVHKKGGKAPVWNEAIDVPLGGHNRVLNIICKDRDILSADDLIGSLDIPLEKIPKTGKELWFPIVSKKKAKAGELSIAFTFKEMSA